MALTTPITNPNDIYRLAQYGIGQKKPGIAPTSTTLAPQGIIPTSMQPSSTTVAPAAVKPAGAPAQIAPTAAPSAPATPPPAAPAPTPAPPATYTPPTYQDLLTKQTDITSQMDALKKQLGVWAGQYNSNHMGGISGDQYASYIGPTKGKLAQLQKDLDQNKIQLLNSQEQQQYQTQQSNALKEQQDMQQRLIGQLPGIEQGIGKNLADQTQAAFTQLSPQIEQRLNALGLLQSGALPEAQAKAFTSLQNSANSRISDFDMNARNQLQLQYPLAMTSGDLASQQQALQGSLDMGKAGLTRDFQQQDIERQMAFQQQMQYQALQEARAAQQQQGQNALYGSLIGAGGSMLGGYLGGPAMAPVGQRLANNGYQYAGADNAGNSGGSIYT